MPTNTAPCKHNQFVHGSNNIAAQLAIAVLALGPHALLLACTLLQYVSAPEALYGSTQAYILHNSLCNAFLSYPFSRLVVGPMQALECWWLRRTA